MEDGIGEKKLLCAVIERACMDATGRGGRKRFIIDAQEWINSQSNHPFSYIWICEQLQINPSIIRRTVKSMGEKDWELKRSEMRSNPNFDSQRRSNGFVDLHRNSSSRKAPHRVQYRKRIRPVQLALIRETNKARELTGKSPDGARGYSYI